MSQLAARLICLVRQGALNNAAAQDYTSTAKVQGRLQEGWSEQEESALRSSDAAYVQIARDIEEMLATADVESLREPHKMAQRDPEFVASAWQFDAAIRALNRELAV